MAKLKMLLLAVLLTTGAILSAPKTSFAVDFCQSCALTQDCLDCCFCAAGRPTTQCMWSCNP